LGFLLLVSGVLFGESFLLEEEVGVEGVEGVESLEGESFGALEGEVFADEDLKTGPSFEEGEGADLFPVVACIEPCCLDLIDRRCFGTFNTGPKRGKRESVNSQETSIMNPLKTFHGIFFCQAWYYHII